VYQIVYKISLEVDYLIMISIKIYLTWIPLVVIKKANDISDA